jgi:2,4'-dihydroxyacetophenone dioxygenase
VTTTEPTAPAYDLSTPLPTIHRGDDDLPWVRFGPEVESKVAHVKLRDGLWVARSRIQPGAVLQTHRHTGPVFGFTLSGAWHYRESADEINRAGSYLYEPAGSTHTLQVLPDSDGPADVWFAIYGANINLDDDGNIDSVLDGALMLSAYLHGCRKLGIDDPPVVVET